MSDNVCRVLLRILDVCSYLRACGNTFDQGSLFVGVVCSGLVGSGRSVFCGSAVAVDSLRPLSLLRFRFCSVGVLVGSPCRWSDTQGHGRCRGVLAGSGVRSLSGLR